MSKPEDTRRELGLLSDQEFAEALYITPRTLTTWRALGRGPKFVKFGNTVMYRVEDIKQYANDNVQDPQEQPGVLDEAAG